MAARRPIQCEEALYDIPWGESWPEPLGALTARLDYPGSPVRRIPDSDAEVAETVRAPVACKGDGKVERLSWIVLGLVKGPLQPSNTQSVCTVAMASCNVKAWDGGARGKCGW